MIRSLIKAVSAVALTISTGALAQGQTGTAQEARAMLDKAVAAVRADRDVALAMFNKGEGGFRDRDLYPFCFRIADGKLNSEIDEPRSHRWIGERPRNGYVETANNLIRCALGREKSSPTATSTSIP
jgi:hypothetical protein